MNITRKAQLSLLENPSLAHSRHFGLCCWKILAPGMPKCLTQILLIPAQRIPASGDSLLKPLLPGTPAQAGVLC